MNLNSILAKCFPLCIGFRAGNKFLDRYGEKDKEITQDENGFQQLSEFAKRGRDRYLTEIASLNGYGPLRTLILKLGFQLGSD